MIELIIKNRKPKNILLSSNKYKKKTKKLLQLGSKNNKRKTHLWKNHFKKKLTYFQLTTKVNKQNVKKKKTQVFGIIFNFNVNKNKKTKKTKRNQRKKKSIEKIN